MSGPHGTASLNTLVRLLRQRADHAPNTTAYTFLEDGQPSGASRSLTYAQLDARARAIAATLRSWAEPGDRALLVYPPGVEFIGAFFGCLYAGVVPVPIRQPSAGRTAALVAVAGDCGAVVALTRNAGVSDSMAGLPLMDTDAVRSEATLDWSDPNISADGLALLQYTSGSTGAPRGVMVTHANLLANLALLAAELGHHEPIDLVSWLPHYHDMGLIGHLLYTVYLGGRCTLLAPEDFLRRPVSWLEAVSHKPAVASAAPDFGYALCARAVRDDEIPGLDLHGWGWALCGAEPVRAETFEGFTHRFAPAGFRAEAFVPTYGLAEATLFVSGGRSEPGAPVVHSVARDSLGAGQLVSAPQDAEGARLVGCGKPGQSLAIVDPETCLPLPVASVGEIWISGPSVARGYWGRPDATRHTFGAAMAGNDHRPFLRTGDLGFIDHAGELVVTGRLKDLMIVRGRNYYPQDIEYAAAQSHPSLQPDSSAAFPIEADGEERAVVVQEIKREHWRQPLQSLPDIIRAAVAEATDLTLHTVLVVKPGDVPRTSSGKVRRQACKERYLAGKLRVLASTTVGEPYLSSFDADRRAIQLATPLERAKLVQALLHQLTASLLQRDVRDIDLAGSLTSLGFDSLAVTRLQHALESHLGVILPFALLMAASTLGELAGDITRLLDSEAPAATAPPPTAVGPAPASYGQESLWYLNQMAPDSAAYNLSAACRIRGPLDVDRLRRCFAVIVERHAALRTIFDMRDGVLVQHVPVGPALDFAVDRAPKDQPALEQVLAHEAARPFDLSRGPLLRVRIHEAANGDHVLLLCAHHIVADYWSLRVVANELGALYGSDPALPSLPISYAGFTRRQRQYMESTQADEDWRYWQRQLADDLPLLNLPVDHPRPKAQTFSGGSCRFRLDAALTAQLDAVAQANHTTLFTVLLAAYTILLHRYTAQDQIAVGVPTAGRQPADLAALVGYLVNPVVIRTQLDDDSSFIELLAQVRKTLLDAVAHAEFPFPLLVERLRPNRDPGTSPLFQTMFVLQQGLPEGELAWTALNGVEGTRVRVGELALEAILLEQRAAQFELALTMVKNSDGLSAALEFNTDLFDVASIERMAGHLSVLLSGIAEQPDRAISQLPILTSAERWQLLVDWNDTATPIPDVCVHQLFEAQVERTPDAVALVYGDEQVTYRVLDLRANQLAHHLQRLGVGSDVPVGIFLERSPDLIVGLLGVLKAGAAYVPLDPDSPKQRLSLMLDDARPAVIVTSQHLLTSLPARFPRVVCMDIEGPDVSALSASGPSQAVRPDNLAYVIYTSGSTGTPKGVMVEHRSVVNYLTAMASICQLAPDGATPLHTPVCFDMAVANIFLPLLTGSRIVLAPTGPGVDGPANLLTRQQFSLVKLTPSHLQALSVMLPAEAASSAEVLLIGGEALSGEMLAFWSRHAPETIVINEYGPTEATVACTTHTVLAGDVVSGPVPIGRPIANAQIYILDTNLQPVPIGVAGELCVGGACLARGYLNRPDLTAERFFPSPFSPGALLYRTGDRARYLPDGTIEYLGRNDDQVKIRGFRIELGEIEATLLRHPAVAEAAVVVREDTPGDRRLVAYVVPASAQPPGDQLRAHLREHLPEYMLPSAFALVSALPLAANGKLDRAALPPPAWGPEMQSARVTSARDDLERQLGELWGQLLGISSGTLDVEASFFDQGGHSLLAVRLLIAVEERYGQRPPLTSFLQAPTISGLARQLRRGESDRVNDVPAVLPVQKAPGRRAGTRCPLFLVTASYGTLMSLNLLAEHLAPDQACWTLQPPGSRDTPLRFESIEALAGTYVEAIRSVQPHGPYVLMGYSVGGLTAFEAAQQLVAGGEEVAFLGLLDTLLTPARRQQASVQRALGVVARTGRRAVHQGLLPAKLEQWLMDASAMAQLQAASRYRPRPFPGRVTLFAATQLGAPDAVRDARWRKLALEGLVVIPVGGRHDTMLHPPHVRELGQTVQRQLQDALA